MKNKIRLYNKKNILRGLVSVGFLLLIFCLNSREVCAETPTVEFTYKTIKNVNNEDEVEITGCTITGNVAEDIVIPKTINVNGTDLPVTSIGLQAFLNNLKIKSVDTSDVLYVGNLAFSGCENLISVNMPKVTQIGEGTFDSCIKLESVAMPNVTSIGSSAFVTCSQLSSIDLANVTTVGNYAFMNCDALQNVSLPDVKNIGIDAFRSCNNLESVSMPNAKSIGGSAFNTCTSLNIITITNVESIGEYAFRGCTGLTSITLPKVTSIASEAFGGCPLTSVYVSGNADGSGIPQNAIYLASPISLDKENLVMEPGESETLSVTVPQNAADKRVSWKSSNEEVVQVDDTGKLTAIGGGTVTITVTANDVGKATATCEVTVIVHASKIILDKNSLTMNVGDKDSLNVGFEPDETTNRDISWTSSDSDVVSVDSLGNITAKSAGKAVVTATLVENNEIKSECVVTVKQAEPDPDPDPEPEPEPIPVNETFAMNQRLYDSLSRATNLGGSQTVYFEEYNGNDCITGDVLNFLSENPGVTLVLDYTFFDETTQKEIHCHVVINQAILSKVMRDDIKYYGAAILSGFVQYYDDLPAEIKNKNL